MVYTVIRSRDIHGIYCDVELGHTVYTVMRSRDIHSIYCAAESGHT